MSMRPKICLAIVLLYCVSLPLALLVWLSGYASLALSNSAVNWVYGGGLLAPLMALWAWRLNGRADLQQLGLSRPVFTAILWLSMLPLAIAVGSWVLFFLQNQG